MLVGGPELLLPEMLHSCTAPQLITNEYGAFGSIIWIRDRPGELETVVPHATPDLSPEHRLLCQQLADEAARSTFVLYLSALV